MKLLARYTCLFLMLHFAFCIIFAPAVLAEEEAPVAMPSSTEEETPVATPTSVEEELPSLATPTGLSFTAFDVETVSDPDDLENWLYAHEQASGTVMLGDDITLEWPIGVFLEDGVSIVIDTGKHSLIFDGGCVTNVGGELRITGQGVDSKPVVDVVYLAGYWMGNWNNLLQGLHVEATGRDGQGGTAMRIREVDARAPNFSVMQAEVKIRSVGGGAVGLSLESPIDIACFNIEVEGADSIALYAPSGSKAQYCKLSAKGEGACVAVGEGIVLDACHVTSPVPPQATVITRQIWTQNLKSILYVPIAQNDRMAIQDAFRLLLMPVQLLLRGSDGSETVLFLGVEWEADVEWTEDENSGFDVSKLGPITIPGRFDPPFMGLGLIDELALRAVFDVRDPALPCISSILIDQDGGDGHAAMGLWRSYDPSADGIALFRSDDGGETWKDVTNAPDIAWNGDEVRFYYGDLTNEVWFQLRQEGVGASNIASIFRFDEMIYGGFPGDRTGVDLGGDDGKPDKPGGNGGGRNGDTGGGYIPLTPSNPSSPAQPVPIVNTGGAVGSNSYSVPMGAVFPETDADKGTPLGQEAGTPNGNAVSPGSRGANPQPQENTNQTDSETTNPASLLKATVSDPADVKLPMALLAGAGVCALAALVFVRFRLVRGKRHA